MTVLRHEIAPRTFSALISFQNSHPHFLRPTPGRRKRRLASEIVATKAPKKGIGMVRPGTDLVNAIVEDQPDNSARRCRHRHRSWLAWPVDLHPRWFQWLHSTSNPSRSSTAWLSWSSSGWSAVPDDPTSPERTRFYRITWTRTLLEYAQLLSKVSIFTNRALSLEVP